MGPIEICNMALSEIGVKNRIGSFDEESEEARLCHLFYVTMRDYSLSQHDWPFARRRAVLSTLADGSPTLQWRYRFQIPGDCVTARSIDSGTRDDNEDTQVPFDIETSEDGQSTTLLCDLPAPTLVYTSRLIKEGAFPSSFALLVALNLATKIALPLSVMPQLRVDATQLAGRALVDAVGKAQRNRQEDKQQVSEYERARK